MQLMAGGAGKTGAPPMQPPPGAAPDGGKPPVAAPMNSPQPKAGEKQNALINVSLAMDLIEQALGPIGSETEEGGTLIDVLSKLSKRFGEGRNKSKELAPAQLIQMMQNLPQAGGMSPEMKALMSGGGAPKPPGGMPGAMPPQPMPQAA